MSRPVVVVTGGASGIGAACCSVLAAGGFHVIVADVNDAAGKQVAADVGGDFVTIDVGDAQAVDAAAEAIEARFGAVSGLVTSAGVIQPPLRPEELGLDLWDKVVQIDQRGTYVTCLAFGRRMAARGTGGAIVNIASVAGLIGGTPALLYPTSKGAVVNMTRAMAAHHGVEGIRVNCVAPGMVYTPMVAGRMTPEVREQRRKRSLLQTEGSGWDVGQAVAYLASDEARWVTGVILPVDAGATAGNAPSPGLRPDTRAA